ncbi:MAG: hypothetical protein J6V52_05140 [Bacteroidaceae bacterium]|nr:hypothetical protein [Bacteroidaceae bacterium]
MATVETLELRIVDNSVKAANGVNKLAATLQRLKGITSGNLGLVKVSNQMERFTKAISGLNEDYVRRLERTAKAIQKISTAGKLNLPTYNQIKRATEPSKKKVEEVIPETKQSGIAAFLNKITSSLGPTNALRLSLNRLGEAADKANKKLDAPGKRGYGFLDSAKFLLKYQLIFKLFSMITNAVKEGISNLYEWSKATNGVFAKSLDSAKSKILLLKNSVATALAPAITALIPVFNAVANAVVFCLNAIAQFISAIRGLGTWTKATEAVDGYTEAVKGAGAAHKGLLASFDELNVIGSSGGGGGGGASNLWEGAFEEKELSPFFAWIKDHLSLVKTLALGVGTAILGWKIASGFITGVGSVAGGFKRTLSYAMALGGAVMEASASSEALTNGNTWDTFIGQLAGATSMASGLFIAFDKIGGAIGLILGGLPMVVTSLKEMFETGTMKKESIATLETGIALLGAAASLLAKNPIGLIIAGVVAFGVEVVSRIDDIMLSLGNMWTSIKDSAKAWVDQAKYAFSLVKDWIVVKLVNPFMNWLELAKNTFAMIGEWIGTHLIEPAIEWIGSIFTWINEKIITPIYNGIKSIVDWISSIASWLSKPETKVIKVEYSTGKTPSGASYTSTYTPPVSHGAGMAGMEMVDFQAKADGGFVNSGQLFVAREAGPELVGTIGGRTAVANNDQIIAGVASGVAAGQEEQNALLRKQNEILTRLLAKEFSAKVVPSAALGRVASQSEAMYRQMAGVNV